MGSDLVNKTEEDFESIKHIDENGVEFWYARELMTMLEYSKWGNFKFEIKNNNRDKLKPLIPTILVLIGVAITIVFSYDEMIKFSNSKGFILVTI